MKKIIYIFIIAAAVVFASPVFASSADGTIDSTYKYAWGENIGWVNFGASNGNVHITDSALSGSALSENIGWINLDNVVNDGAGNLSGYGWSENAGWIKFNPANGGVIINSSGEFTGSALSENIGWIIFGGDYKVKTDWRPRSVRPDCNNALDDDSDGFVDYPSDLGCESLTDTNEINQGGAGLPSVAFNPPTPPAPTQEAPAGSNILINNGDEYTNKRDVELKLFGGSDTKQFAVSQNSDFKNASLQPYQPNSSGFQVLNFKIQDTKYKIQDTKFQVFAKFYTQYGQPSNVVSDAIILDEIPPEKPTIKPTETTTNVKPTEPIKPTSPVEPAKPTEEPTSLITSAQQEIKEGANKISPLAQAGLQWGSSLINNISNQTKQGIDSVANQIEEVSQTIVNVLSKLTAQKEEILLQEEIIATPILKPIPTPEPKDLPPETVVVKSVHGNIGLTPDLTPDTNKEQKKALEIAGLSNQQINVFVKPAKPAFGVLGGCRRMLF